MTPEPQIWKGSPHPWKNSLTSRRSAQNCRVNDLTGILTLCSVLQTLHLDKALAQVTVPWPAQGPRAENAKRGEWGHFRVEGGASERFCFVTCLWSPFFPLTSLPSVLGDVSHSGSPPLPPTSTPSSVPHPSNFLRSGRCPRSGDGSALQYWDSALHSTSPTACSWGGLPTRLLDPSGSEASQGLWIEPHLHPKLETYLFTVVAACFQSWSF